MIFLSVKQDNCLVPVLNIYIIFYFSKSEYSQSESGIQTKSKSSKCATVVYRSQFYLCTTLIHSGFSSCKVHIIPTHEMNFICFCWPINLKQYFCNPLQAPTIFDLERMLSDRKPLWFQETFQTSPLSCKFWKKFSLHPMRIGQRENRSKTVRTASVRIKK